jgi:hypothetical protein
MGGTYQTEFQLPAANCDAFLSGIQHDGFLYSEPFELQEEECLARVTRPEMHDDEFWLGFLAASSSSPSRDVHFHWHRLRGSGGHQLATNIAARVQAIALRHGASVLFGAVTQ